MVVAAAVGEGSKLLRRVQGYPGEVYRAWEYLPWMHMLEYMYLRMPAIRHGQQPMPEWHKGKSDQIINVHPASCPLDK